MQKLKVRQLTFACNACCGGGEAILLHVYEGASHIFQHLQNSEHCHILCSADCFHVLIGSRLNYFSTQDKRGYSYSERTTPLNQQLPHDVNLKLSLYNSHTFMFCIILLLLLITLFYLAFYTYYNFNFYCFVLCN